MNLKEALHWRYSTKSFVADKTIPADTWQQIEEGLRFSASSTNAQPWHFVIAATPEGKKRMAAGTSGMFEFNTPKVMASSHTVLFCTKTELSEDYLLEILEQEDRDGRYPDPAFKPQVHDVRSTFVTIHKDQLDDLKHWNEKQVYLNMGGALLGAALLGVDAVPMEGVDIAKLNEEFGLTAKGLTASAMVCFGYRTDDDFNSKLPKSRLEPAKIFTHL